MALRDQNRTPCGYLWEKTDRQGKKYLAGVVNFGIQGEIPIVVFREENKTSETAPDYVIRNATSNREAEAGPKNA